MSLIPNPESRCWVCLLAAQETQTHSERGGGEERLRARHEARVRRGDGEPPLAVINVDARSVVRIRESMRVKARGLGCVARGCESFSRSRFPNNEKSAPLTKVIVSRDTVYPRRSVLALCVRGNRTKEVSCPRVFIAAPRSNCFARSVFARARAPSSFMRGEWTPHRSAPLC